MRVSCERSLTAFEFWGGGAINARMLSYGELEDVEMMLEDIYPEGMEETLINDLFWFEFEFVVSLLGYEYDAVKDEIIREKEEEEEE